MAQQNEKYYKDITKQLYKHIIPIREEIDELLSKSEELNSEYRSEEQ